LVVEIARPPGDIGKMTGEIDDMLACAASGLDHITGFAGKEPLQHGTDRLVIAVKGRRVEPPVGFDRAIILAEFDDVFSHARPRRLLKIKAFRFNPPGGSPQSRK